MHQASLAVLQALLTLPKASLSLYRASLTSMKHCRTLSYLAHTPPHPPITPITLADAISFIHHNLPPLPSTKKLLTLSSICFHRRLTQLSEGPPPGNSHHNWIIVSSFLLHVQNAYVSQRKSWSCMLKQPPPAKSTHFLVELQQ